MSDGPGLIDPAPLRLISAKHFREVMRTAPAVDDAFADDLRRIREESAVPRAPT